MLNVSTMHGVIAPINPAFGRGTLRAEFKEGPYTITMRQMNGFRRFTCAVAGVEILQQISCPGRDELDTALLMAYDRHEIPKRVLRRMVEEDHGK